MSAPTFNVKTCPACKGDGCGHCGHAGAFCVPVDEGRLIRAATDVARAQRAKGIAKYNSTLEDQNGYTIGGMIDMVAEELADGSVYVQKVREMYLALLDEIVSAIDMNNAHVSLNNINNIIERERNRA